MAKILVIDDDIGVCKSLELFLTKEGHEVAVAMTGGAALSLLSPQAFSLVFTDLRLPDMNGLDILAQVKERSPAAQVIVITGYASIETAVETIKRGAYDYLTKPLASDRVRIITRRALEAVSLSEEVKRLKEALAEGVVFENTIGKSYRMQEVFKIIRQTAGSESTILITGESGTGKELIARAVHYSSPRKGKRFVPVNCGAIARDLIEAELFGYVKGAFTGAARDKAGFLELADSGTLFLDEIGETTPDFQVKLLRVLQEGEFNKVGEPRSTRVDVRIIAATNRDLKKAMADGAFRDDLYYRLNVISIHIPPLRDRREDIPFLVLHFLDRYAKKRSDLDVKEIAPSALEALMHYDYPGNVRELENAVEYAVAFARGPVIMPDDLPVTFRSGKKSAPYQRMQLKPLRAAKHEFERAFVTAALLECNGNISKTARLLDMHRQSLQQRIRELEIDLDALKEKAEE